VSLTRIQRFAGGAIAGGAIGNAIDRLRFGQVVDFIDLHAAGWHWPAFNVADVTISIGAVLWMVSLFYEQEN
jgi:signal peptidase II